MGNRIKFMYENLIDEDILANLTYSSQNASYPASNLYDPFRSRIWRSNAGFFEVTSANNTFVFNDGVKKTIYLTIGTHTTGASLASDWQTKLNAASSNFTVSYSTAFNKFTVSRTTAFSALWTDAACSCDDLLGFNTLVDDTGLTAYESDIARICYPCEYLKFDFGMSLNPKALVILDNKESKIQLQPSIQYKLQANQNDSWINPLNINLTYNENNITKIDMNGLFDQPYRYSRLFLPDMDNPNGFIQIGKIFLGDVFEPESSDVQKEFPESFEDLTTAEQSISGEKYFDKQASHSLFSTVNIELCNKSDVDHIFDIYEKKRTHTGFFVSIDSEAKATNNVNEWTKYVRFAEPPQKQVYSCNLWNVTLSLEELL